MGNGGRVFRQGDVVVRPVGPQAPATTVLLRALATTSFTAPVPRDPTTEGAESFGWIDGVVAVPPFPAWSLADDALASAGKLLRDYHAAVAELELPSDLTWSDELADPHGGPIVCHNDVCPENVVFRDGRAVALLDFDVAAPGRRVWDLAQMARMWAPLRPAELAAEGMGDLEPFHRLAVLAHAYGLDAADHAEFVAAILESAQVGRRFIQRRLLAGEPAFLQAWEPRGGIAAFDAIIAWLGDNRDRMLAALAL